MESKDKHLMSHPPLPRRQPIVDLPLGFLIATVSLLAALFAFFLFSYTLKSSSSLVLARSLIFLILGTASHLYVFSCRSLTSPATSISLFSNKYLLLAVIAGFILQAIPLYFSPLSHLFNLTPLPLYYWFIAFGFGFALLFLIELAKLIFAKLKISNY